MTVLDDAVTKHLRDLFEAFLSLLARLSDGAIMCCAIGDVSLHLRPEQLDRLNFGTEGWSIDENITDIVE